MIAQYPFVQFYARVRVKAEVNINPTLVRVVHGVLEMIVHLIQHENKLLKLVHVLHHNCAKK